MHLDKQLVEQILIKVEVDVLSVVNKFTNISDINLYRKFSNYQHFVLYARIFFGNQIVICSSTHLFCSFDFFFSRGFYYQGFQCQRCDCVVHKACYSKHACPCKRKKYPDVSTFIDSINK